MLRWNDAAEDLLNQILSRTPRPIRDQTEAALKQTIELIAEEKGLNRASPDLIISAWIRNTPESVRPDMARQIEQLGLDPSDYADQLGD